MRGAFIDKQKEYQGAKQADIDYGDGHRMNPFKRHTPEWWGYEWRWDDLDLMTELKGEIE